MLVILGQIDVDAADMEAMVALTQPLVAETLKEPGCLHYSFARDVSNPTRLQIAEWWQDEAALLNHFKTPHIAAFLAASSKLKMQLTNAKRYEVASVGDVAVPE
ncbi:putative quinol monooxygenase [Parapedomonas caeni]